MGAQSRSVVAYVLAETFPAHANWRFASITSSTAPPDPRQAAAFRSWPVPPISRKPPERQTRLGPPHEFAIIKGSQARIARTRRHWRIQRRIVDTFLCSGSSKRVVVVKNTHPIHSLAIPKAFLTIRPPLRGRMVRKAGPLPISTLDASHRTRGGN